MQRNEEKTPQAQKITPHGFAAERSGVSVLRVLHPADEILQDMRGRFMNELEHIPDFDG